MAGRTIEGSLWRRAIVESAATDFSFLFSPLFAAHAFQVVRGRDTSLQSKAVRPSRRRCSPGDLRRSGGVTNAGGEDFGCIAPW